ncbi:L-serine ammonia-lyase, iron-sulfur-dependent, subunit alpha [Bacillota bacterium]
MNARVIFDRDGSYPHTFRGQGSDIGFAGGLMGYLPDNPAIKEALSLAKEQGRRIRFDSESLGAHHPNEARIDIFNEEDGPAAMSVLTFSTGGGSIRIDEMDGFPISYTGRRKMMYFAVRQGAAADKIEHFISENALPYQKRKPDPFLTTYHTNPAKDGEAAELYEITMPYGAEPAFPENLVNGPDVYYHRTADLVVPVPLRMKVEVPFCNAKGALDYSGETGKSMAELALIYECGLAEINFEDARSRMKDVLSVMRKAIVAPEKEKAAKNGVMEQWADSMKAAASERPLIDTGCIALSMHAAAAAMENSSAHNIVVAAPTCGSSGIIPATVVAVGETMGLDDASLVEGLLASGLIGSFIANQATFGAEAAGCQAEVGSSCAMAAGGMVQLMGGSPIQGFRAAAIAMQSFMGLICDPVGGIAEIPCIARNITASSVALTAANMALCGFDPIIPLDETITTMFEVGQAIPDTLRCTCKGGLCTTPTGKRLDKLIRSKNQG